MSEQQDFHIQFKFAENKKWAVIDIETKDPFTGKTLAALIRNLADELEKEPSLNVEESNGELRNSNGSPSGNGGSNEGSYCGAV